MGIFWHTIRRRLLSKLFALCCLVAPALGSATTILETPFEKVVTASQVIFEGQVVAREVRRLPSGQGMTFFTFRIDEIIKGSYQGETIELGFLGSTHSKVHGLRMPEVSEKGVYFVESVETLMVNPLYGWHQGHYTIRKGQGGQDEVYQVDAHVNVYPSRASSSKSHSHKPSSHKSSAHNAEQGLGISHTHQAPAQTSPSAPRSLQGFKQRVRTILKEHDE